MNRTAAGQCVRTQRWTLRPSRRGKTCDRGSRFGFSGRVGVSSRARPASTGRHISIRCVGNTNRNSACHPQPNKAESGGLASVKYAYFNWRKDTISDLVLFALLNVVLVAIVSLSARALHFSNELSMYAIGQILVGQELPEEQSISPLEQVFAFGVSILGLSSFAVVLALVEQAVLEILEANVRQGSAVIEQEHVVLLSWGTSNRDLAQTIRIVKEICGSQRYSWIKEGRLSIVVLSQGREKLEMECIFENALPYSQRAGCRLVFRQGSPLDPNALDIVSVASASTIIVSGDYSVRCRESDAQVLRSAILVDEMLASRGRGFGVSKGGDAVCGVKVVVEVQTPEGGELIADTCSALVRPVPTTKINALRTARLLWHPTASVVSHSLFDHNSTCFIGLCQDSRCVGLTLKELQGMFAYATAFGFCKIETQEFDITPAVDRRLRAGESIILLQSAEKEAATIQTRESKKGRIHGERIERWTEDKMIQSFTKSYATDTSSKKNGSHSGWGVTVASGSSDSGDMIEVDRAPGSLLPAAALSSCDYGESKNNILFCGWPGISYSMELIRALDKKIGLERSAACGCRVTPDKKAHILILNAHDPEHINPVLESLRLELQNTTVSHSKCDPRNRHDLEQAMSAEALSKFKGALTLVDTDWFMADASRTDPHSNFSLTSASMLKMDALILNCQLNIRHMTQSLGDAQSDMIFISEKLSGESRCTRFEDRTRLPLGSSVNSSSFAAKALAQEAILPGSMRIYHEVDKVCRLHVVDTSLFAEKDEILSYVDLQSRAADMQCTLLGFYEEPDGRDDSYVALTLNPQGFDVKNEPRVWNDGRAQIRLVLAASLHFHNVVTSINALSR
jgi:hypothetical protein